VLRVPVTIGTVVMPGESIATIAANAYLLRIEVPERHARFIRIGDPVKSVLAAFRPTSMSSAMAVSSRCTPSCKMAV
jgi:hypothetical protein